MTQPELRLAHSVQDRFFPDAAFADFRKAVLEGGAKPSSTVRALMAKYRCPEPDAYAITLLLKATWPDVYWNERSLCSYVLDSAWPNGDPKQFSDADFDAGVADMLDNPPAGL